MVLDFPGTITIGWDAFAHYLTDIGTSLARHGFRRLLYLNGHGSNQSLVETAARLVGGRPRQPPCPSSSPTPQAAS